MIKVDCYDLYVAGNKSTVLQELSFLIMCLSNELNVDSESIVNNLIMQIAKNEDNQKEINIRR